MTDDPKDRTPGKWQVRKHVGASRIGHAEYSGAVFDPQTGARGQLIVRVSAAGPATLSIRGFHGLRPPKSPPPSPPGLRIEGENLDD